jgi:hypothetical protein
MHVAQVRIGHINHPLLDTPDRPSWDTGHFPISTLIPKLGCPQPLTGCAFWVNPSFFA